MFRSDDSGQVKALVINPGPRQRLMPKVSDETPSPHLPVPEILDLPLNPDEAIRYEGGYLLDVGSRGEVELTIRWENGRLVGELAGGAVFRLRYQGDNLFRASRDPASRATFEVRDGRAVAIELNLHGTVLTGRRVEASGVGPGSSM